MHLSRVARLISGLERDPEHVQICYGGLAAAIAVMMGAMFELNDSREMAISAGQPASERRISHP